MENKGYKQKIGRLLMEIKLLEKLVRKNGWKLSKHGRGCTCTPAKFYHVDKKYAGFAPNVDHACYTCEECGEPLYCDSCIRNYEMRIGVNAQRMLKNHRKGFKTNNK